MNEDITTVSTDIIRIIENASRILKNSKTSVIEFNNWNRHINRCIGLVKKALCKPSVNIGLKKKLQTNLGILKRYKVLLKNHHYETNNFVGGGGLKNKRSDRVKWEELNSAFNSRIRTGIIINLKHKDILQFLNDAFFLFKSRIKNILKASPLIKVNTCFTGEFKKLNLESEISENKYFQTPNEPIDDGMNLNSWFKDYVIEKVLNKLEEFQEKDSGFSLTEIISLEVNINHFEVGLGGSSFIALPSAISNKKACINIKNVDDNACFAWSIVAALYPCHKNSDRTTSYPHYNDVLNMSGIDFPIQLRDIATFEKNNNISVNVYMLEYSKERGYNVVPCRLTKNKREIHVNLLIIQNSYIGNIGDDIDIKYHYVWIKSLSKLIKNQVTKHKCQIFICDRCLSYFSTQAKLNMHEINCSKINTCKISFPDYDSIYFKDFVHKEKAPYIVYADFETFLKPVNDNNTDNLTKTYRYQEHKPFSAGYYVHCSYDNELSFYNAYRGLDCMGWFSAEMENLGKFIESKLINIVSMDVNIDFTNHQRSSCHICEKPFKDSDVIVRDHCHFQGVFRGFAHSICNLNYQKSNAVPIVFHNLSGYDSHFIIRDLSKLCRISLLPVNKERYISFTTYSKTSKIKFRFIDSFRFMNAGLDKLASYLTDFPILRSRFSNYDTETIKLLQCKGVFPYDFVDCYEKLDLTDLPDISQFYNKLNECNISNSEYIRAQKVWGQFKCKTLGEYSDLYMKTDILLLADVFEQFRSSSHKTYQLDPAHYYTLPGYTWNAMLKYTKCNLEIIKEVDMLLMIEKGIRGGVAQVCNRYSEANNKYMPNYDSQRDSNFLLYLDVNNLYGWAMSNYLPYGGFEWVVVSEDFNVSEIADDSSTGYILEVDLEYPENLHDKHKDLPFCPTHITPPNSKLSKLMTTLHNKSEYIIHYSNLKQAIKHGLKLTKIHRILKFKQAPWLKPYIDLNTQLRQESKNEFEKNLYKLLNNAVYGKTMENIRKHKIVKLVNNWGGRYGARNLISQPNFNNRCIFDENLVAIELNKTELVFNKPMYIGMCILDISKVCLYDFHYNYILPKFGNKCKLMYTDTDSLIYDIKCNDIYEDVIKADIHLFDTSDYAADNIWKIPQVNKKKLGIMKDELSGSIMTHFIGLRAKMYTYKTNREECIKKIKGVKTNIVKNKITFDDYLNCLQTHSEKNITQRTIRSFAHNVFSVEQTKIGLSASDDKRYISRNLGYDTLPWGHYSIKNIVN